MPTSMRALGGKRALICAPCRRRCCPPPQVGELELLQAPGLPYQLPRQVADLPILTGAARALRMLLPGLRRPPALRLPT